MLPRQASLAAITAMIALLIPCAASAQIGSDLVPDVPTVSATVTEVPSVDTLLPSASPAALPGVLNDAIDDAVDGATGGNQDQGQIVGGGGLTGGGLTTGGSGGSGSGSGTTTGSDPGTIPTTTGGVSTTDASESGNDSGATSSLDAGGKGKTNDPASVDHARTEASSPTPSYGTAAGHAAIVAAQRAVRLAGPLAPPLILAGVMLSLLIALGRGSDRLVKIERAGSKRAYRL